MSSLTGLRPILTVFEGSFHNQYMTLQYLYYTPLWVIFLGLLILFPATALGGYYIGRKLYHQRKGEIERNNFVPTTILGLLALLLGFTFSMAVARYDRRNEMVVKEANAIGTAFLRTDTLSEPFRTRARQLYRSYVPVRIDYHSVGVDPEKLQVILKKTSDIQNELWKDIAPMVQKDPGPIVGLYMSALNDMIDVSGERAFVMENYVPEIVYMIIFAVTLLGIASLGFVEGTSEKKSRFGIVMLTALFALVISLIQDMDRPRRGLIRSSQQSLLDLQNSIKE